MSYPNNIQVWCIPTFDHQVHDLTRFPLYRYGNDIPYGIERACYTIDKSNMSLKLDGDGYMVNAYKKDFYNGLFCIILPITENDDYLLAEKNSRMVLWLSEHCSGRVYRWSNYFYFINERDAMIFKMRWV